MAETFGNHYEAVVDQKNEIQKEEVNKLRSPEKKQHQTEMERSAQHLRKIVSSLMKYYKNSTEINCIFRESNWILQM